MQLLLLYPSPCPFASVCKLWVRIGSDAIFVVSSTRGSSNKVKERCLMRNFTLCPKGRCDGSDLITTKFPSEPDTSTTSRCRKCIPRRHTAPNALHLCSHPP